MAKQFARHKTVHPSLKRQIGILCEIPGVDRVILGPSRGCRHSKPVGTLKVQTIVPTGIRLIGFSDRGISEFVVISSTTEVTRRNILKRFDLDDSV